MTAKKKKKKKKKKSQSHRGALTTQAKPGAAMDLLHSDWSDVTSFVIVCSFPRAVSSSLCFPACFLYFKIVTHFQMINVNSLPSPQK